MSNIKSTRMENVIYYLRTHDKSYKHINYQPLPYYYTDLAKARSQALRLEEQNPYVEVIVDKLERHPFD